MQIILQDDDQLDSVKIRGYEYKIYPSDITEDFSGRRIVNLFGNRPSKPGVVDLRGLKVQSTCGGAVIDADGIIVGRS